MSHLKETVDRWNSFVDKAYDDDFEREGETMHRIDGPTFYAASLMIVWHDTYGGLRINGKCQVVDMQGDVIPGLYAGGEASGGGGQHGLGRGVVHGYIAGKEAAMEPNA
jgi:predicted oxidoreductase